YPSLVPNGSVRIVPRPSMNRVDPDQLRLPAKRAYIAKTLAYRGFARYRAVRDEPQPPIPAKPPFMSLPGIRGVTGNKKARRCLALRGDGYRRSAVAGRRTHVHRHGLDRQALRADPLKHAD